MATGDLVNNPAWLQLKQAATALRTHQVQDGSIPRLPRTRSAGTLVEAITASILAAGAAVPARRRRTSRRSRADFDALGGRRASACPTSSTR